MNVFGIGPAELVLIMVLALVVLGPEKLPQVMAQVGRVVNELRKTTAQLTDEFNRTIQAELAETRAVVAQATEVVKEARSTADEALRAPIAPVAPNDVRPAADARVADEKPETALVAMPNRESARAIGDLAPPY